ncbi:hypothetical protein [Streptomyces sp. NPDC088785]|uniref:hypothetical protein n=1 Tax=Streptomyces sp. NPDC088785 TaxID=3365897 RepID=UPI0037F102D5
MGWISIERIREPQTCYCGAPVKQTGRWFLRRYCSSGHRRRGRLMQAVVSVFDFCT